MSDLTIELFKKYYKRNTILHKDFDEIDDLYIGFKNGYELSKQQLKDAEEKIEKLKKALEFYADTATYYENGAIGLCNHIIDEDLSQDDCLRWVKKHGGKLARKVLKEIEG